MYDVDTAADLQYEPLPRSRLGLRRDQRRLGKRGPRENVSYDSSVLLQRISARNEVPRLAGLARQARIGSRRRQQQITPPGPSDIGRPVARGRATRKDAREAINSKSCGRFPLFCDSNQAGHVRRLPRIL